MPLVNDSRCLESIIGAWHHAVEQYDSNFWRIGELDRTPAAARHPNGKPLLSEQLSEASAGFEFIVSDQKAYRFFGAFSCGAVEYGKVDTHKLSPGGARLDGKVLQFPGQPSDKSPQLPLDQP
jgi:hypothetical protein